MDFPKIPVIVYHTSPDGQVKTNRYDDDVATHEFIAKVSLFDEKDFGTSTSMATRRSIFSDAGFETVEVEESTIAARIIDTPEELEIVQQQCRIPNITTSIRCQNCETIFRTKYQYQRHNCDFNAKKVILKTDATTEKVDREIRIKYSCETCGKQFVSTNNLDRHRATHESTQENVCEHCNKKFVTENRLRIHKENHCKKSPDINKFYRSDVAVWKCIKCNEVLATLQSANHHVEICIGMPVVAEGSYANVEKVLTELLLQCEFCNRTYCQPDILMEHQKQHTTACNYQCVMCTETFDSFVDAAKHWMTNCSDISTQFCLPKMIYCDSCDRTFKSHELLYGHKIKKKHYTPKIHNNPISAPSTSTMVLTPASSDLVNLLQGVLSTVKTPTVTEPSDSNKETEASDEDQESLFDVRDSTSETNENQEPEKKKRGRKRKVSNTNTSGGNQKAGDGLKFQCERCSFTFDSIIDLDGHREEGHVSTFSCEQCGQVIHSAKALVIHSRAHQSLKPYVCEQCGRSYSQTSHLWQHMRFHQGIKPFACPHDGCDARYTIRPDLKDHIRKVHTRERPFKCSVCSKSFLTGSVYYQHRLIHTDDRRYGCDLCDKKFFRADALNNHRRIHTDERPYPCEICGRQFRQKGDRNKHMRTQHP